MRRKLVANLCVGTVGVLCIGVLAGCGGGGSSSGGGSPKPQAAKSPAQKGAQSSAPTVVKATVRETEMKLEPGSISLKRPGTLEIKAENVGHIVHALSVTGPAGKVSSGPIQPGSSKSFKVKLTKPGTYTMLCPVDNHAADGMKGTIRVG